MPDSKPTDTTTLGMPPAPSSDAPDADADADADDVTTTPENPDLISDISGRIAEAHNILIALSSDPSVDEMSAAIGLSLSLDRAGKRATAIYSGKTPNALEFLKPEDTFESSADTLQDFVIAMDKDKADHLRYKLDGDFVKIFVTPYKTRISEEDLEFSYGDYNIDLVLALNVSNGVDLDSALREHGRIMHDATIVNITNGNPGKFAEIEWSDKTASSISEMTVRLLLTLNRKLDIDATGATAFLTGIVAATNHFSNAKTTATSMEIASSLLKFGADQQLVSDNITGDNYIFSDSSDSVSVKDLGSNDMDAPSIDIAHDSNPDSADVSDSPSESEPVTEFNKPVSDSESASEPKLAPSSDTEPTLGEKGNILVAPELAPASESPEPTSEQPSPAAPPTLAPSSDFVSESPTEEKNYGKMLEDALAELNPATSSTPTVSSEAAAPAVPDLNFQMPDEILPPPPAPAINSELPPLTVPESTTEQPTLPTAPEPSLAALSLPTAPTLPTGEPAAATPASDSSTTLNLPTTPETPTTAPSAPADASAFQIPTLNP